MEVCVKNLLRPAHLFAFVFGFCPYRKFTDDSYRRSTLGTILQLANVILVMSVQVYEVVFYIPREYLSLRKSNNLVIVAITIFFSVWLTVDRFIFAPRSLRCLRVADDLVKTIYQISSLKQKRTAFRFMMFWTILYLMKLLIVRPERFDPIGVTLYITQFFVLYCETLTLEFITVICIALETIVRTLNNWHTIGSCDINALNKLRTLYLKTANLAELVNDAFGISWMMSILSKTNQIVLLSYRILKMLGTVINSDDTKMSTSDHISYSYLMSRLMTDVLRCFQICYYVDQPEAKRIKIVEILSGLITQNSDSDISIKMNEFRLQVALRKMGFTGGGFCDINLHYFVEMMGTCFTLLVIMVQVTAVFDYQ